MLWVLALQVLAQLMQAQAVAASVGLEGRSQMRDQE
jgi:hypothetical protein